MVPQANASFVKIPIFDLVTTSDVAGATDAVYTLHLENPDPSEIVVTASIMVPVGYSVDQEFITSKSGIKAGSAFGHCPEGSSHANMVTTTTPGRFTISFMSRATVHIIVSEPTPTTPGTMEFTFSGQYALLNPGCYADFSPAKGFFVNPSTLGAYVWAPSTAAATSGSPVTMESRPGFSQTVTIVGTGETTSVTATEVEPSVTTQADIMTSVQPVTTTPVQTTVAQTTVQTTSSVIEVETTVQPPAGGQLPMELIAGAVALVVIIAAAGFFIVRRRGT